MVLKKIYVHRKQFPLILAFAVTVHKCQGLLLDCAMMDLSYKLGVLCGYGIRGTVPSEETRESPPDCFHRAGNQGQY